MSFVDPEDIPGLLEQSKSQAHIWREDYEQYERLMDNGLMEGLDPNLPEVNDGSLSAALFKLPKRIYDDELTGTIKVRPIQSDDNAEPMPKWLPILANIEWKNYIIPNANTQAPFDWKWKAAIRKAAGYGSVPIITLSVHRDGKNYTDFIVGQPQDVTLEPGKVSDYDSDIEFWDVYFTKVQFKSMIEQAKEEMKSNDSSNKWNVPQMETILKGDFKEQRDGQDIPLTEKEKKEKTSGFKFTIVVQRGVDAPFYMHHGPTDTDIREWDNPDPTGDSCIHFLYCYQDLINPYGIGICKLAGGTQNVLDYMRQADILATQLGLRPPLQVQGDADEVDFDSLIYAQDAPWIVGNAKVERMELSNAVYSQLPARISMYQSSLQKLIPTGDTSASSADSGDPTQSKTPAGVQLAAANLSIDDEDFKDNFYATYTAVANSMLNTHFANMEGTDTRIVTDDERDELMKAGLEFPQAADGSYSNQVEIVWDTVRGKFSYEIDASDNNMLTPDEEIAHLKEISTSLTPQISWALSQDGWKADLGEVYYALFSKMNLPNFDSIITKMTEEEANQAKQQPFPIIDQPSINIKSADIPKAAWPSVLASAGIALPPGTDLDTDAPINFGDLYKDPSTGDSVKAQIQQKAGLQPEVVPTPQQQQTQLNAIDAAHSQAMDVVQQQQAQQAQEHSQRMAEVNASQAEQASTAQSKPAPKSKTTKSKAPTKDQTDPQVQANVEAVMKHYNVDQPTALKALAAEHAGLPVEDIIGKLTGGQA